VVAREPWSWGRLQRHQDLCVAHALCSPHVRAALRRWGRGERDLRDFYMRMSDAGMRPDRREAALADVAVLERYWQEEGGRGGRRGRRLPDGLLRWVCGGPATAPSQ
jgi:hypothetical protein